MALQTEVFDSHFSTHIFYGLLNSPRKQVSRKTYSGVKVPKENKKGIKKENKIL